MVAITLTGVAITISTLGIAARQFPEFRREPLDGERPVRRSGWQTRTVESLSVAEDLLDQLESRGVLKRELVIRGNADFEVRWQ